jgi:hypothetical protein
MQKHIVEGVTFVFKLVTLAVHSMYCLGPSFVALEGMRKL